eukprot:6172534-Pleurochrysis_carterae.AAC.3
MRRCGFSWPPNSPAARAKQEANNSDGAYEGRWGSCSPEASPWQLAFAAAALNSQILAPDLASSP